MRATTRGFVVAGTTAALVLTACAQLGKQARAKATSVRDTAGTLFVDDGGAGGMPVLFLHSFGGSSVHRARQLAHERRSRRAVALDFRAHGKSAAPATMDYGVASFASDIGAVADKELST